MRITQVILSKQLGGAERHVVDLSNYLAQYHDVQVILRRPPGRYAGHAHGGNIATSLDPGIQVQEVGRLFRGGCVSRFIRDFCPDIIHTHLGDAGKSLRSIKPNVPLVGTLHGEYKDRCYRAHDALICVSEWQQRTIPASFSARVAVVPNFVPDRIPTAPADVGALRAKLGIAPDALVFGAVGRLSPEKGFDTLLRAFQRAELDDAVLVIVGEGPQRPELESLAPANVFFAGWQSDPWPFFHLFDLFVISSHYEPFGIVVLEAMQSGTPVIATRSQGPAEILANGLGLLVDVGDVNGMAEALKRLASSPELRAQLGQAGRKKAEEYRIEAIVPRIEALYREMIS